MNFWIEALCIWVFSCKNVEYISENNVWLSSWTRFVICEIACNDVRVSWNILNVPQVITKRMASYDLNEDIRNHIWDRLLNLRGLRFSRHTKGSPLLMFSKYTFLNFSFVIHIAIFYKMLFSWSNTFVSN